MIESTRHFVVYDKNTGRIIRTGSVPILPAEMDICMARAQVSSPNEWYLVTKELIDANKCRVDLPTLTLVHIDRASR
jgi:hypothetical protein